ncbi:MAG: DUF2878 domain-containing protein [Gammaproteobacteria bacterium]|jgi:hypothetical protein|nr:DUF2878 domain-containing protein [Gammaproteobacteria bacterium]
MTSFLGNGLAFYAVWAAAAYGAARGLPWLGVVALALWLPLHLRACGASWRDEARLLAAAGALGYAADSLLVWGGWLAFPEPAQLGGPTALWMVGLWVGFAATLRHSFRLVLGRPLLAAALGAAGGPFSYWAGERLGAITLGEGGLIAVAVEWGLALPALAWLAARRPSEPAGAAAEASSP